MPEHVGRFTGPEARRRFLAAYDAALRLWPQPYTELDVETRFGTTHVVRHGDGPPVVLLHGAAGNSSNWFPQAAALGREYTVHSVDTIDDPGRSVQRAVVGGPRGYAAWLDEVLTGIDAAGAHLVGFSYGGFLALCAATHGTVPLSSVTLLDPGGLTKVPARFLGLIALQALTLLAPRPVRTRLAGPLGMRTLVASPELTALTMATARGWRSNRPAAPRLTDDELRSIHVPVLVLVAGRSLLLRPDDSVARARALIPDVRADIVPGPHGLPLEAPELVNRRILEFLAGTGLPGEHQLNADGPVPDGPQQSPTSG